MQKKDWAIENGTYKIQIGSSSGKIILKKISIYNGTVKIAA